MLIKQVPFLALMDWASNVVLKYWPFIVYFNKFEDLSLNAEQK